MECKAAKPIVDLLEIDIQPEISIKRIDILTTYGKKFSDEYFLSTPGFILLNTSDEELFRYTGVPNKLDFVNNLKEYV